MTPRQMSQLAAWSESLAAVDEKSAEKFKGLLRKAYRHQQLGFSLFADAWAVYHETLGTKPRRRKSSKGGA